MASITQRIQRHRDARRKLRDLVSNPNGVQVIHYSCESFYDRVNRPSPRITSIAIRNMGSHTSRSFSISLEAEVRGLTGQDIEPALDVLEKSMLDGYFDFVRGRDGDKWLNWNMRDVSYGFQAIEHRYKVLKGQPVVIPELSKVDLSDLMTDIYGLDYMTPPHLRSLVRHNSGQITEKDMLSGKEEAEAFEKRAFFELHLSTLRKVHVISDIAELADSGRLKTYAKLRDIYGLNPEGIGELLKDHWLVSLFVFLATVAGLILAVVALFVH